MKKKKQNEQRAKVAEFMRAHPEVTYREIAETLQCSLETLTAIAKEYGCGRSRKKLTADVVERLVKLTKTGGR
jgi:putative heme iron utilization protein